MILETLVIDPAEFERRTGWALKPEGACKDDICVPLAGDPARPDVTLLADRLGMPLVHDEASGLWSLGPESSSPAPRSARAPSLTLPDLDGNLFALDSLRGQKVLLVAWASW